MGAVDQAGHKEHRRVAGLAVIQQARRALAPDDGGLGQLAGIWVAAIGGDAVQHAPVLRDEPLQDGGAEGLRAGV